MKPNIFHPEFQSEDLNSKLYATLEKLGEVVRVLQWEKAKKAKVSPLQLQVIIFLHNHEANLRKVASLAEEFSVTKPTMSDTVKSLSQKGLILKETDPQDARSTYLHLTAKGESLAKEVETYPKTIFQAIADLGKEEKSEMLKNNLWLIAQMNKKGIISPSRMCFSCRFYKGNYTDEHHCNLLNKTLLSDDLRIDCPEHQVS